MINHFIGADTRLAFEWVDTENEPIDITAASFAVTDREGESVTLDSELTYSAGIVRLHINDADNNTLGNYTYTVTATSETDVQIISTGLLRIRQP